MTSTHRKFSEAYETFLSLRIGLIITSWGSPP